LKNRAKIVKISLEHHVVLEYNEVLIGYNKTRQKQSGQGLGEKVKIKLVHDPHKPFPNPCPKNIQVFVQQINNQSNGPIHNKNKTN
jgi:hypothetical protein